MAPATTFAAVLEQVEDGQFASELTEQLRSLVADMTRLAHTTGGAPKGKLTLTLDMKFVDGVMEVRGDTKVTSPKPPRQRSIFYAMPDGALSANNPKQMDLGLGARETRDVTAVPQRADIRALP